MGRIHKNWVFIAVLIVTLALVDSFILHDSPQFGDSGKMKTDEPRWGLDLEHFQKVKTCEIIHNNLQSQEPIWMDLLNIPDNSNILGSDMQVSVQISVVTM